MKRAIFIGLSALLAIPALAQESRTTRMAAPRAAKRPVDCVAVVDAAALRAVERMGPVGQVAVSGDPVRFGPDLLRVDVNGFPGGQYAVEIKIDRDCHVLSATTTSKTDKSP